MNRLIAFFNRLLRDKRICWVTGKPVWDCPNYPVNVGKSGYSNPEQLYDCPSCGRTCIITP